MESEALLNIKRNHIVERQHKGYVLLLAENREVLYKKGNTDINFFLRSCEKPIQAYSLINHGVLSYFGIKKDELAVICASHSGLKEHTKRVKNILKKADLKEKNLLCGSHNPLDIEEQKYLIKNNLEPKAIHNNCSGKHAGMLCVCKKNGWDTESYLDFNHPLQKDILKNIEEYCEIKDISLSTDGCGAPTHGMSLYNMGVGFLNFFNQNSLFKEVFLQNPVLIGGNYRLDTEIIKASGNTLVSKVGAEGLCMVYNPLRKQVLMVKILDSNMEARGLVVAECLRKLNWLDDKGIEYLKSKNVYNLEVENILGHKVGKKEFLFSL